MSSRDRASMSFVERHNLWSDEQHRHAAAVEKEIEDRKLELVRFSFADQHGVLRGKTVKERMKALIAVAHPLWQERLSRQAYEVFRMNLGS